jgi:hypothetical protein
MSDTCKLPPSDRDIEIYESVHIQGCSTYDMADRHHISQTRVRQIVRRVVEWLGEVLPPQTKVAKEQEIRLARQIAADRFQHLYEKMTYMWDETQDSKYFGLRIRVTTAQARLGAVGGVAAGLAADAIEGLPVPAYVPQAREGEAPAEPTHARSTSDGHRPGTTAQPWSVVVAGSNARFHSQKPATRRGSPEQALLATAARLNIPPIWLMDPIAYNELTPEIIAAREAAGRPIPQSLIQYAIDHGILPRPEDAREGEAPAEPNPKSEIQNPKSSAFDADPSPPPPGDCLTTRTPSTENEVAAAALPNKNTEATATCDQNENREIAPGVPPNAAALPLLNATNSLPVTELRLTPDHPASGIRVIADAMQNSPESLAIENYNPT